MRSKSSLRHDLEYKSSTHRSQNIRYSSSECPTMSSHDSETYTRVRSITKVCATCRVGHSAPGESRTVLQIFPADDCRSVLHRHTYGDPHTPDIEMRVIPPVFFRVLIQLQMLYASTRLFPFRTHTHVKLSPAHDRDLTALWNIEVRTAKPTVTVAFFPLLTCTPVVEMLNLPLGIWWVIQNPKSGYGTRISILECSCPLSKTCLRCTKKLIRQ
jgi:hypothetical protein